MGKYCLVYYLQVDRSRTFGTEPVRKYFHFLGGSVLVQENVLLFTHHYCSLEHLCERLRGLKLCNHCIRYPANFDTRRCHDAPRNNFLV